MESKEQQTFMTDEEIQHVANEYACAHSYLQVHKETFMSEDTGIIIPVDKLVMVPMFERIRVAVTFGIRYTLNRLKGRLEREHRKKVHFREVGNRFVSAINDAEDCLRKWLQQQGYDNEQITDLIILLKSQFIKNSL